MAIDINKIRQFNIMNQFGNNMPDMNYGMQGGGQNIWQDPPSEPQQNDPYGSGPPTFPQQDSITPTQIYRDPLERVGQQGTTSPDLMKMMNEAYTPSTVDRDRLRGLMDAAPQREEPGLIRRLSAFGMGVGAENPLAVHEGVMYAPHHRAMKDWADKVDPYYKTAALEGQANTQERTLAGNMMTNQVNQNRFDQQNRINEERNRITEQKNIDTAENTRIRNEAYAFKQYHPNYQFDFSGPRVRAWDPLDPKNTEVDLGPSGKLSRMDELNLQSRNAQALETQRGQNQATTATIRANAPSRTTASTTAVIKKDEADRQAELERAFYTGTDEEKSFVEITDDGKFKLIPPFKASSFPGGSSPERVAAYQKFVRGVLGVAEPAPTQQQQAAPVPQQTPVPTGPKKSEAMGLYEALQNPNLTGRNRNMTGDRLRGIQETNVRNDEEERQIREKLKDPNVTGRNRSMMETRLQGLEQARKQESGIGQSAPPQQQPQQSQQQFPGVQPGRVLVQHPDGKFQQVLEQDLDEYLEYYPGSVRVQ